MGALALIEIVWFVLLQPRRGASFHTFFALALQPLTVVGYVYLMVAVSAYLSDRDWDYRLRQVIVLLLGFSCGLFVFALMWFAQEQFSGDLG